MKIPMKLILLKIFQVVLFLCTVPAWGADFIPAITNYTVKDYQGAHQNWACAQGDDGVMYFGNNNGLLVYDGFSWELYKVPGGYIVRSVFVDKINLYRFIRRVRLFYPQCNGRNGISLFECKGEESGCSQ